MKAYSFSIKGRRQNNEDYLSYDKHLYVLCDGIGGQIKGEIASRLITHYLIKIKGEKPLPFYNKDDVQDYIGTAQMLLNIQLEKHPEDAGMGTTLTAVFVSHERLYLAHIGDSRIYLIKPSEGLYWRTWDHSEVAAMVKMGMLTEKEAENHPMKNLITRAIVANDQNEITQADITCADNIETGDILLLCSDGVLEAFSEKELLQTLSDSQSTTQDKFERIKDHCDKNSNDNSSAILIEIEKDDAFHHGDNRELDFRRISI
ncbi:MAG: protein phosphatase 2C domain-containing protein [Bacteroidota bacterium]|nr:protein phosphatase 2C domain-containing protein [Bacteroidota bacterium]